MGQVLAVAEQERVLLITTSRTEEMAACSAAEEAHLLTHRAAMAAVQPVVVGFSQGNIATLPHKAVKV
ncbi:MAG: hypothetical protein CMJ39_00395 [Phycisphaerae bacterium]|nr:hypothetical protein [Phycisphaerae bacterium]